MLTKGDFVSRVINGLNSLNKDQRISRRYILHVGQNIVRDFLGKRITEGLLLKDLNIVTNIDCLEMVSFDTVKCDIIEFKRCKSLMRSKCKLPELFGSMFGASIISVTSLDDMTEFKPITLKQFRRNVEREEIKDLYEYYVKDNYLYLPNSSVRRVNVELITLYPEDVMSCGKDENDCTDVYETEFIVPSKFIDNVVKATIQEVAFKKQIPTDENPNLDSQT